MKFTIKLSKWRTGAFSKNKTGRGETRLLNTEGFMCCLGFACLAKGIKKVNIEYVSTPELVSRNIEKCIPGLTRSFGSLDYVTTNFTDKAIEINDDDRTTVKEKMVLLKQLCKTYGHQVRFIK